MLLAATQVVMPWSCVSAHGERVVVGGVCESSEAVLLFLLAVLARLMVVVVSGSVGWLKN